MPPAAKGARPLWKPFQGVRLLRICGQTALPEALVGMDSLRVSVLSLDDAFAVNPLPVYIHSAVHVATFFRSIIVSRHGRTVPSRGYLLGVHTITHEPVLGGGGAAFGQALICPLASCVVSVP